MHGCLRERQTKVGDTARSMICWLWLLVRPDRAAVTIGAVGVGVPGVDAGDHDELGPGVDGFLGEPA